MKKLKLGIPKGSLESSTIALFAQAGWKINSHSRNYFPSIDDDDISCALVRSQEMAPYVANGTLDLGLTGLDWILETNSQDKVVEINDLIYSKSSNKGCRWVLVVNQDSPIKSIQDLEGKKISTELVDFTKRYLAKHNINAEVEFSWGATEAKVVEGLVDAVVEITETGSTIKAHGLRIVCDLLYTNTKLIANKEAMADPEKRTKIEQIALLLQASLDARHKVALNMNVKADNLEQIMEIISAKNSENSPTINHLYNKKWLALETIVDRDDVRNLIPKLKNAGAEGIFEYELKKLL
jgi:ATP phosphoribosyltransferase